MSNAAHSNDNIETVINDLQAKLKKYKNTSAPSSYEDIEKSFSKNLEMCSYDELQFMQIELELLQRLKHALLEKKSKEFKSYFDAKSQYTSPSNYRLIRKIDNINEYASNGSNKAGYKDFISYFSEVLGVGSNVHNVEIVVDKYVSQAENRGKTLEMKSATLVSYFRIDYSLKSGERKTLNTDIDLHITKLSNKWLITGANINKSSLVASNRAPAFKEVTNEVIAKNAIPTYLRREAIRRGGYSLAVGKSDKSTIPDIFVGTFKKSVYLENDNNVYKAKKNAVSEVELAKAASFSDFNNDGNEDLLVAKFVPMKEGNASEVHLFSRNNGTFVKKSNVLKEHGKTDHPMPIAVADFNSDSFLDLYVGFPGAKDFTTFSILDTQDKIRQGVYINDGKNNFLTNTKVFSQETELSQVFPHSSLAVDYDLDGDMDLIVIDDRGNVSPMYINENGSLKKADTDKIGISNDDFGMGVDLADLNNDGRLDFLMTNVNFHSTKRLKSSCLQNWYVDIGDVSGEKGLKLFSSYGKSYVESSAATGLERVGEGVGGVKVFDYNNDGNLDVLVVNGLWTGDDENKNVSEVSSIFSILETLSSDQFYRTLLGEASNHSQSNFMNLLIKNEENKVNGLEKRSLSLAGAQRNRLYRNNGDNTFTDVSYIENIDSIADGYMVATFDVNNDGRDDLIFRNADPGSERAKFSPVQVYKNNFEGNNSVVLRLVGTKSNRDAIGAIATAKIADKQYVRHLVSTHGTIQSERYLSFGLGNNSKIDELEIRWPSGNVSKIKNLKKGIHKIIENNLSSAKLTYK